MPRLRRINAKDRYYYAKHRQENNLSYALKSKPNRYYQRKIRESKIELIQRRLGVTIGKYLINCYRNKLMSCQEIAEDIKKICDVLISRQTIWKILKLYYKGTLRAHKESMKVRAITGRMDYAKSKKHTDYKNRQINYKKAVRMKLLRQKNRATPKVKIISLKHWQIEKLRKFAKKNLLTLSDALRIKYFPKSEIKTFIVRARAN